MALKVLNRAASTQPAAGRVGGRALVVTAAHPSLRLHGLFPCRTPAERGFNKYAFRRVSSLTSSPAQPATQTVMQAESLSGKLPIRGCHHVALLIEDLERSLAFYTGVLGLDVNPDRPHDKLPYRGAWLWIGPEMIHLMELPSPDPLDGRPVHGGRDRHFCIGLESIEPLVQKLDAAGVPYTRSASGRPAVFFRDPDMNVLECVEIEAWR